jgi:hypothetical protein
VRDLREAVPARRTLKLRDPTASVSVKRPGDDITGLLAGAVGGGQPPRYREGWRPDAIMTSSLHVNMRVIRVADMTTSETGTVSLTVRVPVDLRKRLRVYAAEHGMSVQDCAQSALVAWLDQQESEEPGS